MRRAGQPQSQSQGDDTQGAARGRADGREPNCRDAVSAADSHSVSRFAALLFVFSSDRSPWTAASS